MGRPKLLVFASGSKTGGGSGFENLVDASRVGTLSADVIGVVSNHAEGGVYQRAKKLGIRFLHFPGPWTAQDYFRLVQESGADYVPLSGWLKPVVGINPAICFNIHPGPLPAFGGAGFYGHHVHEAVLKSYRKGQVKHSEVCMHFVTAQYDRGPVFFRCGVEIERRDTAETLAARVNAQEHFWQPVITNLVVNGMIRWDGVNAASLEFPYGYTIYHPAQ